MKAMLLAAGIGSRLQPLTLKKPKALIEVAGKTMLEHSITHLKHYGFTDIIINLHHFPDQIKDFLKNHNSFDVNITFSEEHDKLLDTGGAIKKASQFFGNEPFLVYNSDILTNLNLWVLRNYHKYHNGMATLVVRKRESTRYLLFDNNNRLIGWENTKNDEQKLVSGNNPSKKLAFSGIHILDPSIFKWFPGKDKFSIIETYLECAKKENIYAFIDDQSYWFDIGNLEKLEKARTFMGNKKNKSL